MLIRRTISVIAAAALAAFASASSTARNPVKTIGTVRNPSILTSNHRVTAVSNFDIVFDISHGSGNRVRLSLEPNEDVFVEGAAVHYLDSEGNIARREPIKRLQHKVYKGTAWVKRGERWDQAGWARVSVKRDGMEPLFEGAFTVDHDHHHVQLAGRYKKTRLEQDPDVDLRDDDYMVVFRDSDISTASEHTELRKRSGELGCPSDELQFNMDMGNNPVFESMKPRDENWFTPFSSLVKRQNVDQTPGSGNGAGVNLAASIGSTAGCPSTRKVARVGVAVDCNYRKEFASENEAKDHIIQQMSGASTAFESSFNISLGLANLIITDAQCPTTVQQATPWNRPCSNDFNIQERLNSFSQWRGQQNDEYSHWTLLSTCNTGSAVGLAWLGQACTAGSQINGNGGANESVAGANVVIRTSSEWQVIAHETGHTFGAVHDCNSDLCGNADVVNSQQCCPLRANTCDAGEAFIMNPSTAQGIKNFSPCSVGNICTALGRNSVKSNCLTNNRGVETVTGQTCGNGIVEGDEECDCGGEAGCQGNSCCNPTTCKLEGNAVCDDSNEDCCRDCQFASASTVCRPSSGPCDPEEKCTGSDPYCPEDKTKPDGQNCAKGLKCASGQCTSRDMQCKTVMGSYTEGNDTYACDNSNCMLSCGSPEFGRGVCYGLMQNFLDGTPCGLAGKCSNGQCKNSDIKSWIDDHKAIVIGVAAGVGGLIFLCIFGCCWRSYKRRKQHRKYAAQAAYNRANPPQTGYSRDQRRSDGRRISRRAPPPPPNGQPVGNAAWGPPGGPPPQGWGNAGYAGGQNGGYAAPQGPPPGQYTNIPSPPPMYQRSDSVRYA